MVLGILGFVAGLYAVNELRKEVKYECIDKAMEKKSTNLSMNKDKIRLNFDRICKRSGIKIRNGQPTSLEKLSIAEEYLKMEGYNKEEINYFVNLCKRKYNNYTRTKENEKNKRVKRLLKKYENANTDYEIIVYRKSIFNSNGQTPEERMQQLMHNELWSTIVENYSYIRGGAGVKFEEIWTFKVPKEFFKGVNKDKLYKDVCSIEGVYYGL